MWLIDRQDRRRRAHAISRQTYGVRHALLVGPNSGYNLDNRCMLDAIARSNGFFKGIAVVPNDASLDCLRGLKAQGVAGVAFNMALHGLDHYSDIAPLLGRLADNDLFAQIQVTGSQMAAISPMLNASGARILIDHCGRPEFSSGSNGANTHWNGLDDIIAMSRNSRATVKLSGLQKFSTHAFPFEDCHSAFNELLAAFGAQHCVWASDWPFLKAAQRLDYGPLLKLFENLVPDADVRHAILWDTPKRLFGF
jgi:predicted TIM-barrel fold metal-dependent hydrolase